jgi:flagellar hook-associated protein 1
MSGLLNVGTRALQANQTALQTAGNNIANVNTPGYSRQSVVVQTVQGQFSGGGYIGKGVEVVTIKRDLSTFLTTQAALAGATQAGDAARADKLKQLEGIFEGGANGLGAAVSEMMNAFSDVASAPTDLTARTVVLTRVDETAKRLNAASARIEDLQQNVAQELEQKVSAVNVLAKSIAAVNEQIARAQGSGQTPNDLLDQREQLVRDLNQYVRTTSIAADDGTVGIFLGGSQALVLGNTVAPLSVGTDDFSDPLKSKLMITRSGQSVPLDEQMLGGGELTGLLKFQNEDLVEGRNLLGRLTLAITTSVNNQHALGLDLDGNTGVNLFNQATFGPANVLPLSSGNSSAYSLNISISDVSQFAASDYEVNFRSPTDGTITRTSDGKPINFSYTAATGTFLFQTAADPQVGPYTGTSFDGLSLSAPATTTVANGDRFLLKPFSTVAGNVSREFSSPRALAVASPVAASAGVTNTGSLVLGKLQAKQSDPNLTATVTLTFNGAGTFDVAGTGTGNPTGVSYTPGQAISYNGWSLTLQGAPKPGDTFTIQAQPNTYRNLNAGNADAMWELSSQATFDGAALTDGYASLIAQIGIRAQSANYAAEVSDSIASNLEKDRTSVSGVNLDEEAAKLLQYQQAYQASAKMIQIAQSIFDTLIQTLAR